MKLNILGKQRKGKKSFELMANDYECFRIEALKINSNETTYFENVTNILWRFSGESVELTDYDGTKRQFNFICNYRSVKILHASINKNYNSMVVTLSPKEADDVRNAFLIAMHKIDTDDKDELKAYADRLEILLEKFR